VVPEERPSYYVGMNQVAYIQDDLDHKKKLDILVFEYWKLVCSDSCMCNQVKTITISTKIGLEEKKYNKTQSELNAKLGFDLASISAKVSSQKGSEISIAVEYERSTQDTFPSPECGERILMIYQRFNRWNISLISYGFTGSPKPFLTSYAFIQFLGSVTPSVFPPSNP
jgi:hypothetical protein